MLRRKLLWQCFEIQPVRAIAVFLIIFFSSFAWATNTSELYNSIDAYVASDSNAIGIGSGGGQSYAQLLTRKPFIFYQSLSDFNKGSGLTTVKDISSTTYHQTFTNAEIVSQDGVATSAVLPNGPNLAAYWSFNDSDPQSF